MKTLYSKYPGTCQRCGEQFPAGTFIRWIGRGRAEHYGCPKYDPANQVSPCWDCQSPDGRFRRYGAATPVLCDECDRKRRDADKARAAARTAFVPDAFDMAYEDQCRDACGL